MKRLALVHWNAVEGEKCAQLLRDAGFEVEAPKKIEPGTLRIFRERPPDAFAIDLSRSPSHGRAVGIAFRQYKTTRNVPIVFLEGQPEKVEAIRQMMPDATYSDWPHAVEALNAAMVNAPAAPIVPGTMQGYSGTPLPKKLNIKAGSVVALLGAPDGFEQKLGVLPDGVRVQRQARGIANIILLFVKSHADLERRFKTTVAALAEGGGLWIVWPKKTSGIASDLSEQSVRAFGLGSGLVDYKICAVDETWSGLLFARRRVKS